MINYELVEYRPGRWAKIDARTGMFLGPAGADEVRIWRRQPDFTAGQPAPAVELERTPAVNSQPGPQTLNTQRPTPVLQHPSPGGLMDESTPQPAPKKKAAPQKPTPKPKYPLPKRCRISSSFRAHLMRKPPSTAPGIDLPCPRGTQVRAWAKGKVLRSRWSSGGGRCLWIQHAGGIKTYYAHLRATWVLEGEMVRAGQKIGETGTTGRSTGPHLHFSVVKSGKFVDPEGYLPS